MNQKLKTILCIALVEFCSINSFAQWTSQSFSTTQDFDVIYFLNKDTGLVAGPFTYIYRTTDGGHTWTSTGYDSAMDIYFYDNNNGYIASSSGPGEMKKSTDGGVTWSDITRPNTSSVWCTFATSANTVYFSNTDTHVYKSTTGGSGLTYVDLSASIPDQITDIKFTSSSIGYLVDQDGDIFKTTNSGGSWTSIYTNASEWFTEIDFVDANNAYISSAYGNVYKTTDAGVNWTKLTTNCTQILYGIKFFNANIGLAVGTSGTIIRTTDGGTTWTTEVTNTTDDLYSVAFTGIDTAIVAGSAGKVYKNFNLSAGTTTGVLSIQDKSAVFSVYPNPSSNLLKVENKVDREIAFELLDINGKPVMVFSCSGNDFTSLEIQSLEPGFYILKALDQQDVVVKKLQVVR